MDRMNGTPPPSPDPVPDPNSSHPEASVKEKKQNQTSSPIHHRKATASPSDLEEDRSDPLFVLFQQQQQHIVEARHKLEKKPVDPEQPLTKKQQKSRRKKLRAREAEDPSHKLALVPVSSEVVAARKTPPSRKVDLTNPMDFPTLEKAKALVQVKKGKKAEAEVQLREISEVLDLGARCREGEQLILAMAASNAKLPEKERYKTWWSDDLKGLQRMVSDLALECGRHIESDPIKGTLSIKDHKDVGLTEAAKELYHQNMVQMQHFLTTFYALHADSFRCYLIANLDDMLSPDADLNSKKTNELFESFANALTYYVLALSYISPQSQTIIKKIEVSAAAKNVLYRQASDLIKTVYEMTSHVAICGWERIQQYRADSALDPRETDKQVAHITEGIFPGFITAMMATGMHSALSRCHQFYSPCENPLEHFQERCHQLIAAVLLNDPSLALHAVHTMRDLAEPVDGVCQIPPCPPLAMLSHSDLLLYQEAFRAATSLFINLEGAANQTDDLVTKRNLTEHLSVSAESVKLWWSALFPPAQTDWLTESRRMLKMVASRNSQACQHFDTLMAGKVRTARKLAESLVKTSEKRKQQHSERAQQMQEVMEKNIESESANPPPQTEKKISVSEMAIKDNWRELRDGAKCLNQPNRQKSRGHFLRVSNCGDENKTPEQQAWALYGLASLYHLEASDIMESQCQAAMTFLKKYHAKLKGNISPSSVEGRQFFHNVETFTHSMQEFAISIQPVQKYLRQLIDLTFSKENNLDSDDDLMQSIADAQMDCRSEIRTLSEFAESLQIICEDRKNWIRSLNLPPRTGEASSPPDYDKLLKDIGNAASKLQALVDEFSQKLETESKRLDQAGVKTKPGASKQ